MGEAYSWTEGQVHYWTGAVTASANATALGYATDSSVNLTYDWRREPNIAGGYLPHLGGRNGDVVLGSLLTNNNHIYTIASTTALVHLRLRQSAYPNGDNGIVLYSASINGLNYIGGEGQVYRFRVSLETNDWSAF
jgi:hypothetical protein